MERVFSERAQAVGSNGNTVSAVMSNHAVAHSRVATITYFNASKCVTRHPALLQHPSTTATDLDPHTLPARDLTVSHRRIGTVTHKNPDVRTLSHNTTFERACPTCMNKDPASAPEKFGIEHPRVGVRATDLQPDASE